MVKETAQSKKPSTNFLSLKYFSKKYGKVEENLFSNDFSSKNANFWWKTLKNGLISPVMIQLSFILQKIFCLFQIQWGSGRGGWVVKAAVS